MGNKVYGELARAKNLKMSLEDWKKCRAQKARELRQTRIRLAFWHKRKSEIEVIHNERRSNDPST